MRKYLLVIISVNLTLQIKAQTVSDVEGNIYNTVTIGTQTWMKENLKTTKYNNEIAIPNITDHLAWAALSTPAYCNYQNTTNADTINKYGHLYNWYAVVNDNLCPTGWHVPTDAEWTKLENYLIMQGYNYDGTTIGNKYGKALASETDWVIDNGTGTVGNTDFPEKRNASGFTALPGGFSDNGYFAHMGYQGYWWSSSEYNANYAYFRSLTFNENDCHRDYNQDMKSNSKIDGFSVRCLKVANVNSIEILDNSVHKDFYPNPANDRLYIKNSKLSNAYIIIYDLQGKQVVNRLIGSSYIDISNLSKGIYLVKIVNSGNINVDKLIKE